MSNNDKNNEVTKIVTLFTVTVASASAIGVALAATGVWNTTLFTAAMTAGLTVGLLVPLLATCVVMGIAAGSENSAPLMLAVCVTVVMTVSTAALFASGPAWWGLAYLGAILGALSSAFVNVTVGCVCGQLRREV